VSGWQVAGDLALSDDKTSLRIVSGSALAEQQIRNGLQTWRGIWRYDPAEGLPMLEELAAKNPDLRVITQIFQEFLLSRGGVVSVESVNCLLDATARNLRVEFSLTCDDGSTLTDSLAVEVA
jgi:hypothetical protein